ncbi:hypothetical protein SLEP1_g54784 [Rubroshorea leprosula]|uniref:Uncharacterized protein n=1 Tax=Rubroshorea leprosula TaxID=152421 RepID=A0AAV5MDI0_9ROSI|nr:hypothetical protein SLEP1_g54784 [Rubroshorea leprosula]
MIFRDSLLATQCLLLQPPVRSLPQIAFLRICSCTSL